MKRPETAPASDPGRSRPQTPDSSGVFENEKAERLLVVAEGCDGAGGQGGRETAAGICVEAIRRAFGDGDGFPDERLRDGFFWANRTIWDTAREEPGCAGMVATAAALIHQPDGPAWLGWVGDCRAYRYRSGRLHLLSRDHSVVSEWLRLGILTAEEAVNHPRSGELLRSLGVSQRVEPEVRRVEVLPGDRILLCSRALSEALPEEEIAAVLDSAEPGLAVEKLTARVADNSGGRENATVRILALPAPKEISPPAIAAPVSDRVLLRPSRRSGLGRAIPSVAGLVLLLAIAAAAYTVSGGDRTVAQILAMVTGQPGEQARIAEVRRIQEEQARRQHREPTAARERSVSAAPIPDEAESAAAKPKPDPIPVVAAKPKPDPIPVVATKPKPDPIPVVATKPKPDPIPVVAAKPKPDPIPVVAAKPKPAPIPVAEKPSGESLLPEVGSAPPLKLEPPLDDASLQREIAYFLADWALSVRDRNFELGQSLGFVQSEQDFHRIYRGSNSIDVRFELLEYRTIEARLHRVRVRKILSFQKGEAIRSEREEQELLLRETEGGLRYEEIAE
ncbi:MAG: hypothetical protein GY725_14380 [bacterium]|nr:hypothetical protein [bacterium]